METEHRFTSESPCPLIWTLQKSEKDSRRLETDSSPPEKETPVPTHVAQFGEETEEDRVKELADAEQKNLWEATEVIDMDKV